MSKYLNFVLTPRESRKTEIWRVHAASSGVFLGFVKWLPTWRKYTFFPEANTIYDPACLRELADFCEQETKKHKDKEAA